MGGLHPSSSEARPCKQCLVAKKMRPASDGSQIAGHGRLRSLLDHPAPALRRSKRVKSRLRGTEARLLLEGNRAFRGGARPGSL